MSKKSSDPDWSRTNGLLLRRQLLYPTELRDLKKTPNLINFSEKGWASYVAMKKRLTKSLKELYYLSKLTKLAQFWWNLGTSL